MDVVFERTQPRGYAVEIRRPGEPPLRMDPAPGFDPLFPHDMQHLIVEEQLGIADGIFGRLAAGGTASTFTPVGGTESSTRDAARRRRRLARRNTQLASTGGDGFARSERATYVAWQDWLAASENRDHRRQAAEMATAARHIRDQMGPTERAEFDRALPRLRERISQVTEQWHDLDICRSMTIVWELPSARRRSRLNAN